ncbi:vegetative cell wall protein gp1-like [Cryptomeria japonica]|uniref:vegetative cell wall protein gp1-like n=1 Tax=Cryptomeria japonica TaxID=3369 RepID=UPI0027DA05A2|nr:vegetative cell wall protein gp1-like [Cryptomeria japonica]
MPLPPSHPAPTPPPLPPSVPAPTPPPPDLVKPSQSPFQPKAFQPSTLAEPPFQSLAVQPPTPAEPPLPPPVMAPQPPFQPPPVQPLPSTQTPSPGQPWPLIQPLSPQLPLPTVENCIKLFETVHNAADVDYLIDLLDKVLESLVNKSKKEKTLERSISSETLSDALNGRRRKQTSCSRNIAKRGEGALGGWRVGCCCFLAGPDWSNF